MTNQFKFDSIFAVLSCTWSPTAASVRTTAKHFRVINGLDACTPTVQMTMLRDIALCGYRHHLHGTGPKFIKAGARRRVTAHRACRDERDGAPTPLNLRAAVCAAASMPAARPEMTASPASTR